MKTGLFAIVAVSLLQLTTAQPRGKTGFPCSGNDMLIGPTQATVTITQLARSL